VWYVIIATTSALSAQDSLSDALAIEGFLFAAYAISIALVSAVEGGRSLFFTSGLFAWVVWAVITAVAAAAFSSLLSAYDLAHVHGALLIRSYGLAAGIVGPVAITFIINIAAGRQNRSAGSVP
jgi:hypothetical protein